MTINWDNLFSGVLGAAVILAIQWLAGWWTRPRLSVKFSESMLGHKVFTSEVRRHPLAGTEGYALDASQTYKAMYVSICVRNEGRRNAEHCRGFLVGIDVRNGNRWEPTDYCDSIPLAWSYRPDDDARHGIEIPQGVDQFLNVFSCRQPPVDQGFRPATVPSTLRFAAQFRFKEPGEFRFRIQIAADDVPAKPFGLYLRWDGQWDDDFWKDISKRMRVCQCTDLS